MDHELPFPLLFAEPFPQHPQGTYRTFDASSALADLFGPRRSTGAREKILIVAVRGDAFADTVVQELIRRGRPVQRLDLDALGEDASLALHMDPEGRWVGSLNLPDGQLALDEVRSVLLRRPGLMPPAGGPIGVQSFVAEEYRAALSGLLQAIDGARWVNPPSALLRAGVKLTDLSVARAVGFTVPRTVVTDRPEVAREFIASCSAGSIIKAFNWLWDSPEGRRVVYTHRIEREHLAKLDAVRHSPCLLQEEVARAAEVRTVVVGERVFAGAITTQAGQAGPVDWRDTRAGLHFEPASLPELVALRCVELVRRSGLAYAAIDLIRRPDGEHVFLDLNPLGNYLHLEEGAGLPITSALADLLEREPESA